MKKRKFGGNENKFSFGHTKFEVPDRKFKWRSLKGRGIYGSGSGGISGFELQALVSSS